MGDDPGDSEAERYRKRVAQSYAENAQEYPRSGNRPDPELHAEVIQWLRERPEDELKELGQAMANQFKLHGRPGRPKGRRWWIGAVAVARAFMQYEAKVRADVRADAVREHRSETRHRKARCYSTGKVIFSSKSEAKRKRSSGRKKDRLRVYFCQHCHGYHYTSRIGDFVPDS